LLRLSSPNYCNINCYCRSNHYWLKYGSLFGKYTLFWQVHRSLGESSEWQEHRADSWSEDL